MQWQYPWSSFDLEIAHPQVPSLLTPLQRPTHLHPADRILQHQALPRLRPHQPGGLKEHIRVGLTTQHLITTHLEGGGAREDGVQLTSQGMSGKPAGLHVSVCGAHKRGKCNRLHMDAGSYWPAGIGWLLDARHAICYDCAGCCLHHWHLCGKAPAVPAKQST
jgi:hypothetical protein